MNKTKLSAICLFILTLFFCSSAYAQSVSLNMDNITTGTATARIFSVLALITILSLAPSIVIMMTSFTRLIIVFSITRSALSTNATPPNMVLIALALFMTIFIMSPTLEKSWEQGIKPVIDEKIEFIEDDKYGKLKKITYYVADVDYPLKTIIYERYGSTTGWAITNHAVIDGGGPGKMICAFDEMGEVVYKRKYTIKGYGDVKDCYINAEVGTNVNLPKKKESVYYNSQDRTLRVDFERDEKIEIYNAMGKRVMRKKINEGCKSINCNLNAGVYIVTVKNSNTHTKIVAK